MVQDVITNIPQAAWLVIISQSLGISDRGAWMVRPVVVRTLFLAFGWLSSYYSFPILQKDRESSLASFSLRALNPFMSAHPS